MAGVCVDDLADKRVVVSLPMRGDAIVPAQPGSGAGGLQIVETTSQAALATRSGVLVDRAGAGHLVQDRTDLAELGLCATGVLLLDGIKERLHLRLDAALAFSFLLVNV